MAGETSGEPVYFWRETEQKTGFLSQWYSCPFRDDEDSSKVYLTAEHYMMHHKALLFNDTVTAAEVLKAKHPRDVKGLGRKVTGFSNDTWVAAREAIVHRGNVLKFTAAVEGEGRPGAEAGSGLLDLLLRTGSRELVEASPYDRIWGIGFTPADAAANREMWGDNLLGKVLMEVRASLAPQ